MLDRVRFCLCATSLRASGHPATRGGGQEGSGAYLTESVDVLGYFFVYVVSVGIFLHTFAVILTNLGRKSNLAS